MVGLSLKRKSYTYLYLEATYLPDQLGRKRNGYGVIACVGWSRKTCSGREHLEVPVWHYVSVAKTCTVSVETRPDQLVHTSVPFIFVPS